MQMITRSASISTNGQRHAKISSASVLSHSDAARDQPLGFSNPTAARASLPTPKFLADEARAVWSLRTRRLSVARRQHPAESLVPIPRD